MENLSVVIACCNNADRIETTIQPWFAVAKEIIVVDQMSKDGTYEIAKKLGASCFQNDPAGGNFDLNRKFGLQKAKYEWILYIDTDERPTPELISEIKDFLSNSTLNSKYEAVRIPNLFYFLGKPLKHGIYNAKSAEIRMFRKDKWDYPCEKGYHHSVSVQGKVYRFQNAYKHFNVNSVSEWFIKTNQYTEHDAIKHYKDRKPSLWRAVFNAKKFFLKHYIFKFGFLDGAHGFVSVFYFMLYHFTLEVKKWQFQFLDSKKLEDDYLKPFEISKR